MKDNVLLTFEQIVELFTVSAARVRAWIAAGELVPIRREGRGRGGRAWFSRGEVACLLFGVCPGCGGGFKRQRSGQAYCSRLCRDRHRRQIAGRGES